MEYLLDRASFSLFEQDREDSLLFPLLSELEGERCLDGLEVSHMLGIASDKAGFISL